MVAKLRGLGVQLSYVPPALRLIWAAAWQWALVWAVLLVLQGLLPAASVYLTRLLVDGLVAAIDAKGSWETIQPLLFWAAFMGGVLLLTELIQSLSNWVRTAQAELVRDHLSALVHAQAVAVDLAFYESSKYYDRMERARQDLHTRPLALLENAGGLLQNGITLVAMGSLLIPYGVWLPILLLVSTLPAFYVVMRYNRRYHRWWEHTTTDRRRAQYYDVILTCSACAPEVRLFDLGAYFQSAYQALRRRLRTEQLQFTRKQSLAQLGAALVGILLFGAAMVWMGWQALQGRVTLGDLALFQQAVHRGQSLMQHFLENVGRLYTNTLFLGNLFEFFGLKSHVVDSPEPLSVPATLQAGICFQHVNFRYPGSERLTLQDFNLTIPAGQLVAIVGTNGAGKSTLVKLLSRLYDPEAGQITLDGIDIRQLSLKELRRRITVLSQMPVFYHDTAAQNIALGDVQAAPQAADIEAAARSAGAHEVIRRLPHGYDTLLGKVFANGTELSGGEWQRIALARTFLRQATIVILDEPTSFMDSWAEAEWLQRLRTEVRGRTALVITHRFSTAMRADVIYVMHEGQLIESGRHDTLLAHGGYYARSWKMQMAAGSRETTDPLPVGIGVGEPQSYVS